MKVQLFLIKSFMAVGFLVYVANVAAMRMCVCVFMFK